MPYRRDLPFEMSNSTEYRLNEMHIDTYMKRSIAVDMDGNPRDGSLSEEERRKSGISSNEAKQRITIQ